VHLAQVLQSDLPAQVLNTSVGAGGIRFRPDNERWFKPEIKAERGGMLYCLTLLLASPQALGANTAEIHTDPYEIAGQNWQNKTPLGSKIIKGRSVSLGDRSWQVAILNASIPDPLYAHF
jgi:hypothetical protein